jgi:hypothetical protein
VRIFLLVALGLAVPASAVAIAAPPPTVKIFEISLFPVPPIPGDELRVSVKVKLSDGRIVDPTGITCRFELPGQSVATRISGNTCTGKLPRSATTKTVAIRLVMTYRTTTVTKTLRYRVR